MVWVDVRLGATDRARKRSGRLERGVRSFGLDIRGGLGERICDSRVS